MIQTFRRVDEDDRAPELFVPEYVGLSLSHTDSFRIFIYVCNVCIASISGETVR